VLRGIISRLAAVWMTLQLRLREMDCDLLPVLVHQRVSVSESAHGMKISGYDREPDPEARRWSSSRLAIGVFCTDIQITWLLSYSTRLASILRVNGFVLPDVDVFGSTAVQEALHQDATARSLW
jgi:hypothetical protein